MGQCGCGESHIENGYRMPRGLVVAYDIYYGCRDCHSGPAISIYAYPSRKAGKMRLDGATITQFVPDEYGGNHGHGISFGLFEVEDLEAEAKNLVATDSGEIGPDEDQYATIQDWLHDYGLRMVQGAMRRYREREERQKTL